MRYRQLGQSTLEVSEIGFGCMSLELAERTSNLECIRHAFEQGVNYFDTADYYDFGENELLVGDAVSSFRHDIVLATKVGNRWSEEKKTKTWDVSKAYILQAIDASLRRLNTDYIDLYQIHGGTIEDNFEEVVETLEGLKTAGKIRYYGISSIRPNVFTKYAEHSNIVSNMMQYSMFDTRPEEYMDILSNNTVSIIARGVLAQGMLIDKQAKEYLGHTMEVVSELKNAVDQLANRYSVTNESIALQYVLQHSAVASALVGIRTESQVLALLKAYQDTSDIPADNINKCIIKRIKYHEHRTS